MASAPGVPVFMYAYDCDRAHFDGEAEAVRPVATCTRSLMVDRERYAPDEPIPERPVW